MQNEGRLTAHVWPHQGDTFPQREPKIDASKRGCAIVIAIVQSADFDQGIHLQRSQNPESLKPGGGRLKPEAGGPRPGACRNEPECPWNAGEEHHKSDISYGKPA